MKMYIRSWDEWIGVTEATDVINVVDTALKGGLDIKRHSRASSHDKSNTWDKLYPNPSPAQSIQIKKYIKKFGEDLIPELVSGVGKRKSTEFNPMLIDYVLKIKRRSGLPIVLTGGDDLFHQLKAPSSRHGKGNAIDFVIGKVNDTTGKIDHNLETDQNQAKIEKAIIDLIKEGKIRNIGLINEYKNPSGHATGGHFHMSLMLNDKLEYTYYHFIDKDGNILMIRDKQNMLTPSPTSNSDNLKKIYYNLRKLGKKEAEKIEKMQKKELDKSINKFSNSQNIKSIKKATVKDGLPSAKNFKPIKIPSIR